MEMNPQIRLLSRFWWMILLRGVCAVLFGIAAFAWPGLTLASLTMLFAAYALVDGVFNVTHAVAYRREIESWGLVLIEGLCGIAFGVLAFMSPELTTAIGGLIVAFYLAAWAISTGLMRIVMAVRLRKEIEGEWLLGLSGAISILFGVFIMARPAVGVLGLLMFVAVWAIVLGLCLIVFAIKVRKIGHRVRGALESAQGRLDRPAV